MAGSARITCSIGVHTRRTLRRALARAARGPQTLWRGPRDGAVDEEGAWTELLKSARGAACRTKSEHGMIGTPMVLFVQVIFILPLHECAYLFTGIDKGTRGEPVERPDEAVPERRGLSVGAWLLRPRR